MVETYGLDPYYYQYLMNIQSPAAPVVLVRLAEGEVERIAEAVVRALQPVLQLALYENDLC